MANEYKLPPDPKPAVLKRIYPWDEYNLSLVLQWLFAQAQKTGFYGDFEDFKQRYGAYIEAAEPQEVYDLIEQYHGAYHVTPLVSIEQVLKTKNKVLNQDIIIDPIPNNYLNEYSYYNGNYQVTPMARFSQRLRTHDKVLEQDVIIEKIPYAEVSNTAGGITCIIG